MVREKVLVTGGAGFIGSHVADELIAMGKKVVILDDSFQEALTMRTWLNLCLVNIISHMCTI
jgi:nucleoside-diphosphate-sugar epimerase